MLNIGNWMSSTWKLSSNFAIFCRYKTFLKYKLTFKNINVRKTFYLKCVFIFLSCYFKRHTVLRISDFMSSLALCIFLDEWKNLRKFNDSHAYPMKYFYFCLYKSVKHYS